MFPGERLNQDLIGTCFLRGQVPQQGLPVRRQVVQLRPGLNVIKRFIFL